MGEGVLCWQSPHPSPGICALGTDDPSQQGEEGVGERPCLGAKACLRAPTALSNLGGRETLSLESEGCPAQKGELGTPKATGRRKGGQGWGHWRAEAEMCGPCCQTWAQSQI